MGNIKSRALLYLYFVNLFIKKQSTPHHRDKQRKSRKRAVSNRPKKPILRQPLIVSLVEKKMLLDVSKNDIGFHFQSDNPCFTFKLLDVDILQLIIVI